MSHRRGSSRTCQRHLMFLRQPTMLRGFSSGPPAPSTAQTMHDGFDEPMWMHLPGAGGPLRSNHAVKPKTQARMCMFGNSWCGLRGHALVGMCVCDVAKSNNPLAHVHLSKFMLTVGDDMAYPHHSFRLPVIFKKKHRTPPRTIPEWTDGLRLKGKITVAPLTCVYEATRNMVKDRRKTQFQRLDRKMPRLPFCKIRKQRRYTCPVARSLLQDFRRVMDLPADPELED